MKMAIRNEGSRLSLSTPCFCCGIICKLSKSEAVDAGWNFMDIKAPIVFSMALCPTHSKTHSGLFAEKLSEAFGKLKTNPKKVSIKLQFPTGRIPDV